MSQIKSTPKRQESWIFCSSGDDKRLTFQKSFVFKHRSHIFVWKPLRIGGQVPPDDSDVFCHLLFLLGCYETYFVLNKKQNIIHQEVSYLVQCLNICIFCDTPAGIHVETSVIQFCTSVVFPWCHSPAWLCTTIDFAISLLVYIILWRQAEDHIAQYGLPKFCHAWLTCATMYY